MSTTSSIGTASRNYSTVAAWLAAFAAGGWIGQCYNDSQFTAGASFSGHSTSGTNFILLQTGPGQGFKDNAGVQTNALTYNQANGVGFSTSVAYGTVFTIAEDNVTIQGLQIQDTSGAAGYIIDNNVNSFTNVVLDGLIVETNTTNAAGGSNAVVHWRSGLARNCLLVARTSTAIGGFTQAYGAPTFANCTIVKPSTFTANGAAFLDGSPVVHNCAFFGWGAVTSGATPSGSNNSSDLAIAFGTSNQASKVYASQFATVTDTGRDFRAKTGGALIDNGFTDTTDIPAAVDIVGTARPQGTAWDIGCWELKVTTPGVSLSPAIGVSAIGGFTPSPILTLGPAIGTSAIGGAKPNPEGQFNPATGVSAIGGFTPTVQKTFGAAVGIGQIGGFVFSPNLGAAVGIGIAVGFTPSVIKTLGAAVGLGIAVGAVPQDFKTFSPAIGLGVAASFKPNVLIGLAPAIGIGVAAGLMPPGNTTLNPAIGIGIVAGFVPTISISLAPAIGLGQVGILTPTTGPVTGNTLQLVMAVSTGRLMTRC